MKKHLFWGAMCALILASSCKKDDSFSGTTFSAEDEKVAIAKADSLTMNITSAIEEVVTTTTLYHDSTYTVAVDDGWGTISYKDTTVKVAVVVTKVVYKNAYDTIVSQFHYWATTTWKDQIQAKWYDEYFNKNRAYRFSGSFQMLDQQGNSVIQSIKNLNDNLKHFSVFYKKGFQHPQELAEISFRDTIAPNLGKSVDGYMEQLLDKRIAPTTKSFVEGDNQQSLLISPDLAQKFIVHAQAIGIIPKNIPVSKVQVYLQGSDLILRY